jgi:DNA mismatch repair protein MutS
MLPAVIPRDPPVGMSSTSSSSPSADSAMQAATPAMRQYLDAKRQYRDALLFFRMGDFYEMFYEDAVTAARALELTLTSRSKDSGGSPIPMCGVPYHAGDTYIARLVKRGFRVAICDQVEDPRKAKGVVKREVTRVVSPGTLTDASYLDAREPAFLLAILPMPLDAPPLDASRSAPGPGDSVAQTERYGTALLDVSTGEFATAEYIADAGRQSLNEEIQVLRPREIVAPIDADLAEALPDIARLNIPITRVDPWTCGFDGARRTLCEQMQTGSLHAFGLESHPAAVCAAGALVHYLRDTQRVALAHVRSVVFRERTDCLLVDPQTFKHLEVVEGADGGRTASLLDVLDRTQTAMGARMLRGWLVRPLVSLERIQDRLDAVEELAFHTADRGRLRETLKTVHDLERLVARAALGTAGPRDLLALRQSLTAIPRVRLLLAECQSPLIKSLLGELDDLADVRDEIAATIVDEPPAFARDGAAIRDGVDPELDELRTISRSGRANIAAMEEAERARTGINSLKIRYNRVFGYYIEISRANLHAVPDDYHRKQTIAGGERFITPALKAYEERVLGADERILEREIELFDRLRGRVASAAPRIQDSARAVATLDVLAALGEVAALYDYTKPLMTDAGELRVSDGRHPVVERTSTEPFVPNDLLLDAREQQLVILTGPNMGGKSTYLRQTALVCLMAQIGSFVPARQAKLPVVDRIFARVGASDNIARGYSTFMVEMRETARILHTATSRSLVVLDEIGRGTATFDGLSIAWAVAEYLATNPRIRPRTLFATHYHELTDLADAYPGVVNYHVAVREWHDDIVFLRKVEAGRSDRSYGIQVARLAGLPGDVVTRAREILSALEQDELARGGRPSLSGASREPQQQLALFAAPAPVVDDRLKRRVLALDVDHLTPLEALNALADLQREARERDDG